MNMIPEKKEDRTSIVWGILIASALGFLVNIFSSLYYDLFLAKTLTWDQVDKLEFLSFVVIFVALIGYLQFFIYDYPNSLEFNKAYFKRFTHYFFNKNSSGKVLKFIIGSFLLLVLVLFVIFLYILMAQKVGYFLATISVTVVGVVEYFKSKKVKRNEK